MQPCGIITLTTEYENSPSEIHTYSKMAVFWDVAPYSPVDITDVSE